MFKFPLDDLLAIGLWMGNLILQLDSYFSVLKLNNINQLRALLGGVRETLCVGHLGPCLVHGRCSTSDHCFMILCVLALMGLQVRKTQFNFVEAKKEMY